MSYFWNPREAKKPQIEPTIGYGELKAKWGIIIPHTAKAQGAESPSGESEYHYALQMFTGSALPRRTRDEGGVYGAAKDLVKLGCNCTLEPHLNAYNGRAQGFEILVLEGDKASIAEAKRIAYEFGNSFSNHLLRGDGGVKVISKSDRGGSNLASSKSAGAKVALLSEAFFLDNTSDYIDKTLMKLFWERVLI